MGLGGFRVWGLGDRMMENHMEKKMDNEGVYKGVRVCSNLLAAALLLHGVPEIGGATLGVPHAEGYSILGFIMGPPPFMEANK